MDFVYCYRYMWRLKDSDSVNFKIITDVSEGIAAFEHELLALPNLCSAAREYINQVEISRIAVIDPIFPDSSSDKAEEVANNA